MQHSLLLRIDSGAAVLAREETNLASYTEHLARPFEHEQALLTAQLELARIERKLSSIANTPSSSSELDHEAAA